MIARKNDEIISSGHTLTSANLNIPLLSKCDVYYNSALFRISYGKKCLVYSTISGTWHECVEKVRAINIYLIDSNWPPNKT